jgi:hypothetical protein
LADGTWMTNGIGRSDGRLKSRSWFIGCSADHRAARTAAT